MLDDVSVQYEMTEKRIVGQNMMITKVGNMTGAQGSEDYTVTERLKRIAEIKATKAFLELFKLYLHYKLENLSMAQVLSMVGSGGVVSPAAVFSFMN